MILRNQHYRRFLFLCLIAVSKSSNAFHSTASTTRRRPHFDGGISFREGTTFSTCFNTARMAVTPSIDSSSVPSLSLLLTSSSSNSTRNSKRLNSIRKVDQEIVRLGRLGKTEDALALYYSVEEPSVRLMNSAIDACSRARVTRLETAFEIFQNGVQEKGIQPNVFTFGALMNSCQRARDANQAIQLLRSMQEEYGVSPNSVVYSSAISACARSRPPQPEQAMKLLKEAVEEKKLEMNVVGFNAAISACGQAGDWENAILLLNRMEQAAINNRSSYLVPPPDFVTYGTILAACERGEQWELVLKYAKSMQAHGLELDGLAVTSCLHACQQLGLADEALRYLDMMKSVHPVTPQTAKLERSGARQPLRGPDAVAYRLAISACARGGAWKEGIQLLYDFRKSTGSPPDVVAYTSAITGCEYAGKWKEALFLLDKMRKDGVEANEVTMAAVIGACAVACAHQGKNNNNNSNNNNSHDKGDENESEELSEPQKRALQLLSISKRDPTLVNPNIQVYNAAVRVCAEAGDLQGAFDLVDEIVESGLERTEVTYGSLMTACERVGCIQSASKVFRMMKEDDLTPNEIIYGAAISCCRKAKQSERALLLLRKMMKESLSPNAATFNTVLIAQAEGRTKADVERAITVYKLMKSKFATEAGRPNRQTYNILINFFASIQQPLTAEAFLKKMREDGFKPDVDLFTATVAAYERTGQPLKAVQLMESMQEDGYDFYSVKVLNAAFKKAVTIVNKVGKSFPHRDDKREEQSLKMMETNDTDEDNLM